MNLDRKANEPAELTHFSSTKGKRMLITAMATPHIVNTIKRLERELVALKKELNFREFERKL